MTLLLALVAGALIGLSLGALGGGGSILAVPVLVYLLGQDAGQATTGSLVVVGVTSLIGAVTAHRAGNVMLARGVTFGVVAIGGAAAGANASAHVADPVLLAAFAALMLLVGGGMAFRQVRHARQFSCGHQSEAGSRPRRPTLDDPIIAFREGFMCDCPRAVKVLVTATVVGLLTGFFGVGGGFLVVPALVLALALPMTYAAGTSLVVITLTSAAALAVRAGVGTTPAWTLVATLTAASAAGGFAGVRLADRIDTTKLSAAFTVLVLGVAVYTASQALPALV
ncbi:MULTISPECIES: sulfite exporter TauE/SafE family protein [Nocardioides]|uniref:Probable membrane transporter protein n=1 Tax=Nocardioides vastitatis TaxID=2568655 RepID=A0ABW0ZNP2_9ACTN|nr:sulfite exporter TauE/SafE family protein [Nocardioides sp.]THJ06242.1 sulfite exporter TauE/SafE family protein [Nocardioides sp.]